MNFQELKAKYQPRQLENQVQFEQIMIAINEEQAQLNHPYDDRYYELTKERELLESQQKDIIIQLHKNRIMRIELEQEKKEINRAFHQLKHEFIELNPRDNFIKPKAPAVFNEMLDRPISVYQLSVRTLNRLKAADINTLRELVRLTQMELLKYGNFGKKSLTELDDFLTAHNLTWGMNV